MEFGIIISFMLAVGALVIAIMGRARENFKLALFAFPVLLLGIGIGFYLTALKAETACDEKMQAELVAKDSQIKDLHERLERFRQASGLLIQLEAVRDMKETTRESQPVVEFTTPQGVVVDAFGHGTAVTAIR